MTSAGTSPIHFRDYVKPVFGLHGSEWFMLMAGSFLLVLLLDQWGLEISWWSGLALFLSLMIFGHLCMTADRYVAFPGLVAFATCLQLLISPWLSELFPPGFFLFEMVVPLDVYYGYTVPAIFVFWVGLHWPMRNAISERIESPAAAQVTPGTCRVWDLIIVIGLVTGFFLSMVPRIFFFVLYLVSSFKFFGALCWMLSQRKGWQIRAGLVVVFLSLEAAEGAIFYHLIHWTGYFLLVYCYQKQWRGKLAVALVVSIVALGMLQMVKEEYRAQLEERKNITLGEQVEILGGLFYQKIFERGPMRKEDTFGDVLARFNQGWIVSRIMKHVTEENSYAKGQTLKEALYFSIIPRALDPSKPEGASKILFREFTGLPLGPWTSMGLGVVGELYANFGRGWGIFGVFVYGWIIGYVFSKTIRLTRYSIYWWALIPLVLLPAVEPGFNIEDIMNHATKSVVVIVALFFLFRWPRRFLGLDRVFAERRAQRRARSHLGPRGGRRF